MDNDCNGILFIAVCLIIFLAYVPIQIQGTGIGNSTGNTTFSNQEFEKYFHNNSNIHNSLNEEHVTMDVFTYAFLNYSYISEQGVNSISFSEEKARYGEGKILTVHGQLVHISNAADIQDDSACHSNLLGTNGMPLPLAGVSWIALVRRGHCTFEEKVRNVHLKGAAGVIIYNDRSVLNLEKMQIKGITRNITAVITYKDIGLDMVKCLANGYNITAHIIEGRSGTRPINSLNRTSVLFVVVSFIILMVISLIWLIFYYIQKFCYMQTKDQQSRHLCSVTRKIIMKIPTKTAKNCGEIYTELDCCAVCIEVYKPEDLLRILPCKHEFHKSCIDPWLIEHRTCPLCKLDVLKFYGYTTDDEVQVTPMATPIATPSPTRSQNLIPTEISPAAALSTFETVEGTVEALTHASTEIIPQHTNLSLNLTDDSVSILVANDNTLCIQDGKDNASLHSYLTSQPVHYQMHIQQLQQHHRRMLQRFLSATDGDKIVYPTTILPTTTSSKQMRSTAYSQIDEMPRLHPPEYLFIHNKCSNNSDPNLSDCQSDSTNTSTQSSKAQASHQLVVKHTPDTNIHQVTDV